MKKRKLRHGNLEVSAIGFGCMGRPLVPNRRRVESGRRFGGQGDRQLLAAAERREHRTRPGPHDLWRRSSCEKGARTKVVAAFNNIPSEVLFGVFEARDKATPPSMVYCGDAEAGKDIAAMLIHDVGFDPVEAGPLRVARYTEPLAVLVAQLAYDGRGGPKLAYRFERFGK